MTVALKNLEAVKFFALSQVAMGTAVWIAAAHGGDPMPVATHGAATAAFTTQEWAIAVIAQGILLWVSAHSKWAFGLAVSGIAGTVINASLAHYSWGAESGFIVSRGAAAFALAHGLVGAAAALDLCADFRIRMNEWRRE